MDFAHTRISLSRPITDYDKVRSLVGACIRDRSYFMNRKREGLYLDVGSGPNPHPENINLDYAWRPGLDVCCDITKGLPLPDAYVAGVYTEHCIEHIPLNAALFVFREFRRVMKADSWVRIIVPDFEIYVDKYDLFRRTGETSMPYTADDPIGGIYSPAMSVNRIFRDHGHQFIYDFATLREMLAKVGFSEITKWRFGEGSDPKLLLDTQERKIESLYVEARR